MEHGSLLASAVTVGVGVGIGIGLVSARLTAASTPDDGGVAGAEVEAELRRLVVDGLDSGVTFDDFPYYLRSVGLSPRVFGIKSPLKYMCDLSPRFHW